MKTLKYRILVALASVALPAATFAAIDPADGEKDKPKSFSKTVVVRSSDDDEPEVFTWSSDDDPSDLPSKDHAEQMLQRLSPGKRGFLGVGLTDLTPELRTHFGAPDDAGVMVSHVEADSPAAKAGVKVGDIISGVDGKKVENSWSLTSKVRGKKDGEAASLEIWRDRKVQTLTANVVEREKRQIDLGNMIVVPEGMGGYRIPSFDADKLKDISERLNKKFSSPEFQQRLQNQQKLEERMKELEKKLQEMEKKLKERSL